MTRILLFAAFWTGAAVGHTAPLDAGHDLTREIDFEREAVFHLGPTGARGWMDVHKQRTTAARQILITEVDEGSPAVGVLEPGDVLLGVRGRRFDADARRLMGLAIDDAEQFRQGALTVTRWRPVPDAESRRGVETEAVIQLPPRTPFSNTAPYDCARSRELMQESLQRLMDDAAQKRFGRIEESLLALMAVGRPEQMEIVRNLLHEMDWAKPDYAISVERGGLVCWGVGMHGVIMAEYFLSTGDAYVLPALKEHAVKIAMGQSGGGLWGHGFAWTEINDGKLHGSLKGYGALNLAGLPCVLTMVMAEKCGITHPEIDDALKRVLPFFADFVGRGTIGYGYHRPSLDHYNSGRNGQASNGKNAIAGLVFTLAGNRKVSQYYAAQVASSYDEREHGHAGNSFTRYWDSLAVNCGGPALAAAFHKEMRWYEALCRSWDGRVLFQQLGGTYGGATMNLDAARVLANAVPLRKLLITGRDADPSFWLTPEQVDDAIGAGRWHLADYDDYTGEQLIEALDCWSPGAREWIAEALAVKAGDWTPRLVKAAESNSADQRAGACTALGYLGKRAASAVPVLEKALADDASTVRVAAAYALARMGAPARKALPAMLQAVTDQEQESPLEPVLQALSYSLGAEDLRTAPLYMVGLIPQTPEGENPLDGIDRSILYPALSRMLSARSARIRDCGGAFLKYFSREDVKQMAQEIYGLTAERAPDFGMFADHACGQGMDLMARFQIVDGVTLTMDALLTAHWGAYWREPHHFLTLQAFGRTAAGELPRLKAMREKRTGEKQEMVDQTIRAIEEDIRDLHPVRMIDMVGERLDEELKACADQPAKVRRCRTLIENEPREALQHAAALHRLAAMLGEGALEDLLAGLAHRGSLVHEEAAAIGDKLEGVKDHPRWVAARQPQP